MTCILSVVVPVKDEAPVLALALEEVNGFLELLGQPGELIVVDDGSRDCFCNFDVPDGGQCQPT